MSEGFSYSRRITFEEAERAIYLDFESHEQGPPFLAGRLIGSDDLRLTVLDPMLYSAAGGSRVLKADTYELGRYMEGILYRCRGENRRLIAFSEREIEVVAEFTPYLVDQMTACYGNALPPVKKWFRKEHPAVYSDLKAKAQEQKRRVGLKDYVEADVVPCEYPRQLKGKFSPSGAARIVRDQLLKRDGDYSKIAGWRKRRWTNLLKYNKADCETLRCLTLFVLAS